MISGTRVQSFHNRILAALPPAEIRRIQPLLSRVKLESKKILVESGKHVPYAYFLESGLASTVVKTANGGMVEVGVIGRCGIVGLPALLGTGSIPIRTFMQVSGTGLRIRAKDIQRAFEQPGQLRKQISRHMQAFYMHAAQIAACNRLHEIEKRLARWLLIYHDRVESELVLLTHEFVAQMLGTRRSTVTLAAGALHKLGLIHYSRGRITIRDRHGLEAIACECYAVIRDEYQRLGIR